MLALKINDTKAFMVKLLKENTFDSFILHKAAINTFAYFDISGSESGTTWKLLREHVYAIIKGDTSPKSIRISFNLDQNNANIDTDIDAAALFINIHFENGNINLTSAISKKTFSLDKSDEFKWDEWVKNYLTANNIKFVSKI